MGVAVCANKIEKERHLKPISQKQTNKTFKIQKQPKNSRQTLLNFAINIRTNKKELIGKRRIN